jgi:hypothetical protein
LRKLLQRDSVDLGWRAFCCEGINDRDGTHSLQGEMRRRRQLRLIAWAGGRWRSIPTKKRDEGTQATKFDCACLDFRK